jgi:hypothetical protein
MRTAIAALFILATVLAFNRTDESYAAQRAAEVCSDSKVVLVKKSDEGFKVLCKDGKSAILEFNNLK